MDGNQFDGLLRGLATARSRRGAVVGVVGGMLGTLGVLGWSESEAKRHKKKHKKKKGKASPPPASPPPSPPAPVSMADASCIVPDEFVQLGVRGAARMAQTFRARRPGQMTSATVVLGSNPAGIALDVEIWSVNQANAPQAFLAGTTIANIPATVEPAFQPLTATFPTPANVVAGTRYALVIGINPADDVAFRYTEQNSCPDGMLFLDGPPETPFVANPQADLHFETVVTS